MAWDPRQQYQRPQRGGFSFFPPAIKFLLLSNGAIFLAQLLFGSFHSAGGLDLNHYIVEIGSLSPLRGWLDTSVIPPRIVNFGPWQLITYMFLHDGFTHILFNMFALWMFGVEVENTWGTKKFLTYYFICGLGGAASHLILSGLLGAEQGPLLGASGAIFGVLVAFGLLFPNRSVYFFPLFFIPVKAKYFVGLYIALEVYAVTSASDNVSHLAHLGGAVTGVIFLLITTGGRILAMRRQNPVGPAFMQSPPPPKNPWGGMRQGIFNKGPRDQSAVDAEYQDIDGHSGVANGNATGVKQARVITQEEIDRILDKIAASGYQNLTQDERDILFEASRRMEEKR